MKPGEAGYAAQRAVVRHFELEGWTCQEAVKAVVWIGPTCGACGGHGPKLAGTRPASKAEDMFGCLDLIAYHPLKSLWMGAQVGVPEHLAAKRALLDAHKFPVGTWKVVACPDRRKGAEGDKLIRWWLNVVGQSFPGGWVEQPVIDVSADTKERRRRHAARLTGEEVSPAAALAREAARRAVEAARGHEGDGRDGRDHGE